MNGKYNSINPVDYFCDLFTMEKLNIIKNTNNPKILNTITKEMTQT